MDLRLKILSSGPLAVIPFKDLTGNPALFRARSVFPSRSVEFPAFRRYFAGGPMLMPVSASACLSPASVQASACQHPASKKTKPRTVEDSPRFFIPGNDGSFIRYPGVPPSIVVPRHHQKPMFVRIAIMMNL
jgi:hypothetical protein